MTFNILPYFRRFYIISFLLCLQRKTVKNFTIFYGFSTILTRFFSLKSFLFLTFQQLCPDIRKIVKQNCIRLLFYTIKSSIILCLLYYSSNYLSFSILITIKKKLQIVFSLYKMLDENQYYSHYT